MQSPSIILSSITGHHIYVGEDANYEAKKAKYSSSFLFLSLSLSLSLSVSLSLFPPPLSLSLFPPFSLSLSLSLLDSSHTSAASVGPTGSRPQTNQSAADGLAAQLSIHEHTLLCTLTHSLTYSLTLKPQSLLSSSACRTAHFCCFTWQSFLSAVWRFSDAVTCISIQIHYTINTWNPVLTWQDSARQYTGSIYTSIIDL